MATCISQSFVSTSIARFIGLPELFSLETVSKEMSKSLEGVDGKPEAWLLAAEDSGLCVTAQDVEKATIKRLIFAEQTYDPGNTRKIISMHSKKDVEKIIKVSNHMEKNKKAHLQSGGKIAKCFAMHFEFDHLDLERHASDPKQTINGLHSFPVCIGECDVILTLSWKEGTMLLSTEAIDAKSFKPFSIHLRTVLSPLTMQKDFTICKGKTEEMGQGLCCMLQKPAALADMKAGLLVLGLVKDIGETPSSKRTYANALSLDLPGWKAKCVPVDLPACRY